MITPEQIADLMLSTFNDDCREHAKQSAITGDSLSKIGWDSEKKCVTLKHIHPFEIFKKER